MNRKAHENDISIGQDRWIETGDLADGHARAVDIDPCLALVMPLLDSLETHCVAGCCGIEAFDFWPDEIEAAAGSRHHDERVRLSGDLATVYRSIDGLPADVVVSTRMNQYFRKAVVLALLAHIRTVVDGMPRDGRPG
ncbi:DUF6331 family protein [Burkholderia stagnalis]